VIERAEMLRSMTGFGAGHATVGAEHLAVEIRSVNHKFCEVRARLPREFSLLEAPLVKAVKGDGLFCTCGTRSIEATTSAAVKSLPS